MKPVTSDDLNQLFHLSVEMLSIVRSDGTFKHVNAAWTTTLGWSEHELVDAPYIEFVHLDDRAQTMREAERIAQGARAIDFENRYRTKDGSYRWLSWHVTPAADGRLLYCATRDVTEAREAKDQLLGYASKLAAANRALELARRDIQAILDHSPVIVFVTDVAGRYQMLNSASTRITGRAPADMVGRTAADIFPPDVAEMIRTHAERVIATGASELFEETLPTTIGLRTYSVVRFPLRDDHGNISALCGMSLDITEQKAAAEEILQARAEAVRANRAKSDFLSRMSHELRTPLNAVLGFAQLFDRERLSEGDRENVRHILDGGRHLLDLINEVIDISRVESGTLALSNEPVDIHDAIVTAVALIRPLASAQGIVVTVAPPPEPALAVMADRQRLRQVLLNLLSNAVKYNRINGTIDVGIQRTATGRIRVSVRDSGAGIPPQLVSMLFQPFERLGADKTAIEGTGLGLALSKALCEAMGGTLEVESAVDQGSTFTLDLAETALVIAPAGERSANDVPAPQITASRSGVIVYIEDNLANVRLMERIVSRRPGLRLAHAGDGRSGIALVRECQPSVVLLDLQLPEMPGDAVLRELWKDPVTRPIPIVVLTADATRGLPQRLISAGARACLTKPLDVQQVLRTLDELLPEVAGATNG